MDMQTIISFVIGQIGVPLFSWQILKLSPKTLAKQIVSMLGKVFKNPKNLDKISDELGIQIQELGIQLINQQTDQDLVQDIQKIQDEIKIIKDKIVKK